ncbi:MAG: Crp/Fnr family transcriptional regulator, partial [Acidobacteriaceae bacterium]
MIQSSDLAKIPLFANVDELERQRLARRAADIRANAGEWVVREGEEPLFFVLLDGTIEVVKNIVGQYRKLGQNHPGEFFGETPIFLGTAAAVSSRAVTPCRLARFERQQLQELVRDSPAAGELVFQTMSSRIAIAQQVARETPSSRVRITGSLNDTRCRAIRRFLAANRVQYDWNPLYLEPAPQGDDDSEITVIVDGREPLINPSVRQIAEALGYRTVPRHDQYDV